MFPCFLCIIICKGSIRNLLEIVLSQIHYFFIQIFISQTLWSDIIIMRSYIIGLIVKVENESERGIGFNFSVIERYISLIKSLTAHTLIIEIY